jgi:hypothetical protein
MPAYEKIIADLFGSANGAVTVTDAHGKSLTSHDLIAVGEWASNAEDPWIDLVTDAGEAVGIFVAGNPAVVETQPSFEVDGGMVYMIDGDPVPGQKLGSHMVPLSMFVDPKTDKATLDGLSWVAAHTLEVATPASQREITLMLGRRRDEKQGSWKPLTSTFGQFSDAIRDHKVGEKDGPCFLQGESADGNRKSAAQIVNHIIGVDLDSGAPLQDVIDTIIKHGLEAVIYTTHSHLKDTSFVKRDDFWKKMDTTGADLGQLRQYLIQTKGVLPEIVAELEVLDDAQHTSEGIVILVRHKPMPKFRAVFALSEPFIFAKRGGSQQDAIAEWKERYAGFCTAMGFFFDEKCVDPARLFYMPRHKKGGTRFGSWLIAGDCVDLDKFDRVKISRKRKIITGPANAFTDAGIDDDEDEERDRYITEDGFNLRAWANKHAKRFEIETMLDAVVGGDFMRDQRQSGKPGVHIECPFEAEHTIFGGQGTYVVNASDNYTEGYEGGFTFHCVHNACSGRDRLEMLKELIDQGVIDTSDLTNSDYLMELEQEEQLVSSPSNAPDRNSLVSNDDEAQILAELNGRYGTVVEDQNVRFIREPMAIGDKHTIHTERQLITLERNRIVWRESKSGPKKIKMINEWLDWDQRRMFNGIGFYPGGGCPDKYYNTFTGWPVLPAEGAGRSLKSICGITSVKGARTVMSF